MEMLVALLVCVLYTTVHLSSAQPDLRAPVGPWRHKIEWENNGQVYSLLSTGTEYLSPRRRHTRLLLTSKGRSRPTVLARSPRRHQRGYPETLLELNGQTNPLVVAVGADPAHLGASGARRSQPPPPPPPRVAPTAGEPAMESSSTQQPPSSNSTGPRGYSGIGVPRGERSPPVDDSAPVQSQTTTTTTATTTTQSPTGSPATLGTARVADLLLSPGTMAPSVSPTEAGRVDTVEAGTTGDTGTVSRTHALRRAGPTPPLSQNAIETHVSQPDAAPTNRGNVGTEEIDPHYNSRNSVYYNVHPPAGRSRPAARPRRPPGTAAAGHGTRVFHNGECAFTWIR